MADTAATVNEITTHLFGHALARDLSFGSRIIIPRAMSARALSSHHQALDAALGQVADVSTPRAPVELPFLRVQDDNLLPPKPYGGADWVYPNQKEEAEQEEQERVWVDDEPSYDSDATLPVEGEYAYATEAERATDHHQLRAPPVPAPAPTPAVAAAPVSVRVCLEWKPKMMPKKTCAGALPSSSSARKTKKARATKTLLRVALPMVGVLDNDDVEATLAHGVLVKGMAGGKREECLALLKAARQLGRATRRMGQAIRDEVNKGIPVGQPLLSFGRGVNDDVDLMGTGKGVARHAAQIMAALDRLRAPANAAAAAADGVLVQWPECLPRGMLRCPELHPYLDAWAAHIYHY
jgi:hypothetical protein